MFEHSIKVPRLYKTAATIAKKVRENGASIKGLVFEKKHPNIKALYALVVETLQRAAQIDFILKKSELLLKEPRLDVWLARVLITELLWGKKRLSGECKPIKTILAFQQIFLAHSTDAFDGPQKANKVNKPRYVRINTLCCSIEEAVDGFRDEGWTLIGGHHTNYEDFLQKVANLQEFEFIIDIHIKELLIFPNNTQFYKHNAYLDGSLILQDKASCLPVHILSPPAHSLVLDMCAAPGMKTTQIAAKLQNQGTVFAVEMDLKRLKTLNQLVESSTATCVKTINKDVLMLDGKDIEGVEYILVDPSCSGSGIMDRVELSNMEGRDVYRLEKLAGFQIKILKHALKNFPAAKRVVYSTCSIFPEENEAVIQEVLSSTSQFKLINAHECLKGPWINFGAPDYGEIGPNCIYAKPEVDLTNGFFVAVFERLQEGEENPFFVKKNEKIVEVEEEEVVVEVQKKKKKKPKKGNADNFWDSQKTGKHEKTQNDATEAQEIIDKPENCELFDENSDLINKKRKKSKNGDEFMQIEALEEPIKKRKSKNHCEIMQIDAQIVDKNNEKTQEIIHKQKNCELIAENSDSINKKRKKSKYRDEFLQIDAQIIENNEKTQNHAAEAEQENCELFGENSDSIKKKRKKPKNRDEFMQIDAQVEDIIIPEVVDKQELLKIDANCNLITKKKSKNYDFDLNINDHQNNIKHKNKSKNNLIEAQNGKQNVDLLENTPNKKNKYKNHDEIIQIKALEKNNNKNKSKSKDLIAIEKRKKECDLIENETIIKKKKKKKLESEDN